MDNIDSVHRTPDEYRMEKKTLEEQVRQINRQLMQLSITLQEDISKLDIDSTLVIDTNNHISELKRKIFNQAVFSLNELCENAEYYYFVNEISKNNSITNIVF